MRVQMKVSRELLEQMFVLGDRRIVGVSFADTGYPIEPTAQLVFVVEAPDAPDGTTSMEPVLRREADGTVTMVNPGWTP